MQFQKATIFALGWGLKPQLSPTRRRREVVNIRINKEIKSIDLFFRTQCNHRIQYKSQMLLFCFCPSTRYVTQNFVSEHYTKKTLKGSQYPNHILFYVETKRNVFGSVTEGTAKGALCVGCSRRSSNHLRITCVACSIFWQLETCYPLNTAPSVLYESSWTQSISVPTVILEYVCLGRSHSLTSASRWYCLCCGRDWSERQRNIIRPHSSFRKFGTQWNSAANHRNYQGGLNEGGLHDNVYMIKSIQKHIHFNFENKITDCLLSFARAIAVLGELQWINVNVNI